MAMKNAMKGPGFLLASKINGAVLYCLIRAPGAGRILSNSLLFVKMGAFI